MKVVLLCGGKGMSLWPISRDNLPKQFSKVIFEKSLFQRTIELVKELVSANDIFVIAPEEFKFFIKTQSVEVLKVSSVNHIVEKEPKGTLKAVSVGISYFIQNEVSEDETVLILNSDQVWKVSFDEFSNTISKVVLNIPFGKVVCLVSNKSKKLKDKVELYTSKGAMFGKFVRFNEKSRFSNLGVYISSLRGFRDIIQGAFSKSLETIVQEDVLDGVPFEEVISRRSEEVLVFNWDVEIVDIDSISDISDIIGCDRNGNFVSGDVLINSSSNVTAISTKRLVVVDGVRNLNVIETPDVVYVSSSKKGKSILEFLKGREELKSSVTEYRPWGSYTVIDKGENYQIKRITVNPGESLSLQLHYHRSEHWVVVKGTAKVTVDDKVIFLRENESTFIPKTVKHRLENPGKIPLEIIEIQIGDYISEDDIVRFSDIYGR